MSDQELVELAQDYSAYADYIEGDSTISGQTYEIIQRLLNVESQAYSDADVLALVDSVLSNYHQWLRMGEGK